MRTKILSRCGSLAVAILAWLGASFSGQAAALTNGAVVGPFVAGTGQWTAIPNGDFESGAMDIPDSNGFSGTGNFLFQIATGASGSGSIVKEAAESGQYGVVIKTGNFHGPGVAIAYNGFVPLVTGHQYMLSAFVKRLHPDNSRAQVYLDLWNGNFGATSLTNTTEWQFVYATFTASSSQASARVVVDALVSTNDEVYTDNLAITPVDQFALPQVASTTTTLPSGTNVIAVGPFVPGTGHWTTIPSGDFEIGAQEIPHAGYTGAGGFIFLIANGASGTGAIDAKAAESGQYGLDITPGNIVADGIAAAYNGLISVTPGHVYVLSAFVKRLNPAASSAHAYLDLWGPSFVVPSTNTTSEWQFIYGTFTAATATVGARAVVDFHTTPSDEIYFDNLAITRVEDFAPPLTGVPAAQAQAQVAVQIDSGYVTEIEVINAGAGYASTPAVLIDGGGGSGATAVAVLKNGVVDHVIVTSAGSGYTSVPNIYIASPTGDASLSIAVSRVKIALYLVVGERYVVQESNDLAIWTSVGASFVATNSIQLQEFETGTNNHYFRVVESSN